MQREQAPVGAEQQVQRALFHRQAADGLAQAHGSLVGGASGREIQAAHGVVDERPCVDAVEERAFSHPGARVLEPLAESRTNLRVVMGYGQPGEAGRAVIELFPVTGKRPTAAAKAEDSWDKRPS